MARLYTIQPHGKTLHLQETFNTEECIRRYYALYCKQIVTSNQYGQTRSFYRLYARKPHNFGDCMKYDVHCPRCGARMYAIDRPLDEYTLALYACDNCCKEN